MPKKYRQVFLFIFGREKRHRSIEISEGEPSRFRTAPFEGRHPPVHERSARSSICARYDDDPAEPSSKHRPCKGPSEVMQRMQAAKSMKSLLVLGLGNPILRDDSAGLIACEAARQRLAPITDSRVVTFKPLCIGGFDLIYEMEGYDALIVVDAFHTEDSVPGRVRTLSFEDLRAGDATNISGHLISLPRAIELCDCLGLRTPELIAAVVIDVGAEGLEFGEDLSPRVEEAIPIAADIVCRLVKDTLSRIPIGPNEKDVWETNS